MTGRPAWIPTDSICEQAREMASRGKPRVQSLKTNSLLRAKTASKVFASKLDDYWLGLT